MTNFKHVDMNEISISTVLESSAVQIESSLITKIITYLPPLLVFLCMLT